MCRSSPSEDKEKKVKKNELKKEGKKKERIRWCTLALAKQRECRVDGFHQLEHKDGTG